MTISLHNILLLLLLLLVTAAAVYLVRRARRSRLGPLAHRLAELTRLSDKGEISEEEYARARAALLEGR